MYRKSWKQVLFMFLTVVLAFSVLAQPIDAGSIKNPGSGGNPGTWYIGSTPDNLRTNAPILLFVHGLNGSATTWYEDNDMYQTAYNNGYQTAFIDLYDAGGSAADMWDNGSLLAQKIEEIYNHFGKKIVLVAHSKGGVDSQTALVHYQAYPYVSNVITLGSPHHGSQLADLAYSDSAWWLAAILGQQSDGTYSLQTGYMSYFRSQTDSHQNVNQNSYYTFAGTSWGSFGSALYWGGLYLSSYGQNDGAVVVDNAYLPNGTMLRVDSWNHDQIKTSQTFSYFQPYLTTSVAREGSLNIAQLDQKVKRGKGTQKNSQEQWSDQFIRGGEHERVANETFTVEEGVQSITVSWMSDQKVSELELLTPAQKNKNVNVQVTQETGMFDGAWNHQFTIKRPESGEWELSAEYDQAGAYLMTVHYDSELSQKLKLKNQSGNKWAVVADQGKIKSAEARQNIHFIPDAKKPTQANIKRGKQNQPAPQMTVALPSTNEAGVYNITVDVSGETVQGSPFKRTIIKTVFVDDQGHIHQ